MEKRLTMFTLSSIENSITVSFSYSVINEKGVVVEQNKRGSFVLSSAMTEEKDAYSTLKKAIVNHLNNM